MDVVRAVRDGQTVNIDHHGSGLVLTDGRIEVALRGATIRSTDLDRFPGQRKLRLTRDGKTVAAVHAVPNPGA